jgi:hypothetical protein
VTPIAHSLFNLNEGIGKRNCLNDLWIKNGGFLSASQKANKMMEHIMSEDK